jgi:GNAT superfamily N-acetyltransferase
VSPPHGQFLLVHSGDKACGCGAIKRLAPGLGEIKRMWIAPELRGLGAGRRLLEALEGCAVALALHTLRLDTSAPLCEALALYRAAGYVEIAPYNDNPYATHWFEKRSPHSRAAR